jgi:hypothetical protein
MRIGLDIDGLIDERPEFFASLPSASPSPHSRRYASRSKRLSK